MIIVGLRGSLLNRYGNEVVVRDGKRALIAGYSLLLVGSLTVTAARIFRVQLPRKRAENSPQRR